MSKIIKFLILGDLHGDMPQLHSKDFDAIICPGDICGDDIRDQMNLILNGVDESEIQIEKDYDKISLDKGRKILEFLNSQNVPVFIVPGNWDHTPYRDGSGPYILDPELNPWEKIKLGLDNIFDVEFTKAEFEGIIFIGHGSTSAPEPLILEEDLDEEYLDERGLFFREKFLQIDNFMKEEKGKPQILISHNAPYGTSLDLINNPKSPADGEHYGSIITRHLIELNQPNLCISGHIHEGFGEEKIENTLCINSGFRGDINVIIEMNNKTGEIISQEFLGESKDN